jgi:hypothetical protein
VERGKDERGKGKGERAKFGNEIKTTKIRVGHQESRTSKRRSSFFSSIFPNPCTTAWLIKQAMPLLPHRLSEDQEKEKRVDY